MDNNSEMCDNQHTDHQSDATIDNRMGGSDRTCGYRQRHIALGPANWGEGASMSSVVKPKQLKIKTTLDIVPQFVFVDVIDTGTTTHCFLKESNVEKSEKST